MDGMEDKQAQAVPAVGDPATEPIDLAQAFKMLNQANRTPAEEPMGTGVVDDGANGAEESGAVEDQSSADTATEGEPAAAEPEPAGSGDLGGSAVGIDAIDFDARKQDLLRQIQQKAVMDVRKEFSEQNIGYYSINELRIQDDNTGRVRYRNPDVRDERDPDYYFKSRAEAQGFIDAWNKSIDNEFRRAVNQKQAESLKESQPVIQLIDFIPKYNAMDDTTRKVFDSLIEPYTIRDSSGKEIGFSVNLDAAAKQAANIAKQFQPQQQQQQPAAQEPAAPSNTGPALDMHTGHGKSADEKEPTNIGEAIKMYDKMNRSKK